ncbi:MAG: ORF6N domain-containing protein [Candidatus Kapabacteria bacterium]|nr:ORF6N domain-containing protein [Candidatus Kapabacteria bacterium]
MDEIAPKEESLMNRNYVIRGEKIMLDFDLAMLYETETRTLKQAVKRNLRRFPEDFMFELTQQEAKNLVSQFVIPSIKSLGGALPFAFTEQGVAMLSSVLKSEKAIDVNISIMRTFVKLRKLSFLHKEIFDRIENLEGGYESLRDLVESLLIQETKPKRRIGFI